MPHVHLPSWSDMIECNIDRKKERKEGKKEKKRGWKGRVGDGSLEAGGNWRGGIVYSTGQVGDMVWLGRGWYSMGG